MAKDIKLNSAQIMFTVMKARLAGAALDTALDTWTSLGESSVALEAYAQQFVELERAIGLFQDLVYQDMTDVSRANTQMFLSDLNLAQLWK